MLQTCKSAPCTHARGKNRALTNILITAIEDRLVASLLLTDTRQSLNNPETQLLALDLGVHGNILNMADVP